MARKISSDRMRTIMNDMKSVINDMKNIVGQNDVWSNEIASVV